MFPGRNQSHKSLLVARFLGWLMGELVEKKHSHTDALEATFERDDLSRYYNMFDQVNRKLEQLEFTKDKAGIEIERTDEAELPKVPNNNKRLRYMALLPVAVLFGVLGLFLLLEVRSERVGDPQRRSRIPSTLQVSPGRIIT